MNRTVAGIAAMAVVLAGLFLVLTPRFKHAPETASSSPVPASSAPSFDLVIRDQKLVSGPAVLTVKQGDEVTIHVTADVDEELHLHGYDKSVMIKKGVPATLSFTATLTGRFPYELEHSRTHIGALEVYPR